MEEEFIAGGE